MRGWLRWRSEEADWGEGWGLMAGEVSPGEIVRVQVTATSVICGLRMSMAPRYETRGSMKSGVRGFDT
jgi:hypothetical protein